MEGFYFWKTRGENYEAVKVSFNTTDSVYEIEAVSAGTGQTYPVRVSGVQIDDTIVKGTGVTKVQSLTQSAYDNLATKDANTLYLITG